MAFASINRFETYVIHGLLKIISLLVVAFYLLIYPGVIQCNRLYVLDGFVRLRKCSVYGKGKGSSVYKEEDVMLEGCLLFSLVMSIFQFL